MTGSFLDTTDTPPTGHVTSAKEARNFLSAMGIRKPHIIARDVIAAEPGLTVLAVGHRMKFGPRADAVSRTESILGCLLRTNLVTMAPMAQGGGLTAASLPEKVMLAIAQCRKTWSTEAV